MPTTRCQAEDGPSWSTLGSPLVRTCLDVYIGSMRDLATALRALADETRLQMLALVFAHEELCVYDFVEALGIGQSKASRHLQYLKHAGVLDDRKQGLWAFYAVAPELDRERAALLATLRRLLAARDLSANEERLQRYRSRRERSGQSAPSASPAIRRETRAGSGSRRPRGARAGRRASPSTRG